MEEPERNEAPLTDEETRHLRALVLFWESQGRSDLAQQTTDASPAFQRLLITMHHVWLEDPEEFGTLWKLARRFSVIGWFWNWVRRIFA